MDNYRFKYFFKKRIQILFGFLIILLFIPLLKIFYLQIIQFDRFTALSKNNSIKIIPIPPKRGVIYDRNNVILADKFLELVDGFSIGSNDLTQLTLGADRDSSLLGHYDERNEAVLKMLEMAIAACKKAGKYVGICGQAPSDFPEITKFLVEQGVSTISVNPDSVVQMAHVISEMENKAK